MSEVHPASGATSGPYYTLTGSPVKHQLPSPAAIKVLSDVALPFAEFYHVRSNFC